MKKIALSLPLLAAVLMTASFLPGFTRDCLADITAFPTVVETDVCVYGGTSGGVTAAVEAARMGKSVSLVVFNNHLGGMSSGGLGQTDVGGNGTSYIGGLSLEFYTRIGQKYSTGTKFTVFEPHVAEAVFNDMVQQAGVAVYLNRPVTSVTKQGAVIKNITTQDGTIFRASVFIDASYEGDLMARANVSYTIGREANSKYGETINGTRSPNTGGHQFGSMSIDPYLTPGDPTSGLIPLVQPGPAGTVGGADQLMEAYNYRLCFTSSAANKMPFTPPPGYNEATYELFGRVMDYHVAQKDGATIGNFMNISGMSNSKTDINNNGPVSTDFVGQSAAYPDADYATRAQITQAHLNYTQGLIYYLSTSTRVPQAIRDGINKYGLCKDEFTDTGGWPNQLYVREARRMVSDYVMTQLNCTGSTVASDSIGLASYTMDSHNEERIVVNGSVENEGDVEVGISKPYPVAYRALVPKAAQCTNLLVPWCLSASHTGFSSIRMEPVFMILGHAAGTAACIAVDDKATVQNISYPKLAAQLLADGQVLSATAASNAPSIIVDNTDATGVIITGAWTNSTSTAGYYGSNYITDGNAGQGTKSVQYTPVIPTAGQYKVYLNWPELDNRATNVPVDITDNTGVTTEIIVDEKNTDGNWLPLGTFNFNAGSSTTLGTVIIKTISKTGVLTNSYVIADAVGFTPIAQAGPVVSIWATDASAAEPASSTGSPVTGKVTLSRTGPTTSALTIPLSITGTATNGTDYTTIPTSITIPAGASTASITVTPLADNLVEGPETVIIAPRTNAAYTIGSLNSATVTIQDRPVDTWKFAEFTSAQIADTTNNPTDDFSDPTNDGVINLMKYLTDQDPNTVSTGSISTQGFTQIGAYHYLTLTYTRYKAATDLMVYPEVSGDLSNWASDAGSVQQTITADDGQVQTIVAQDLTPLQTATQRYIRLRVSRPQ